MNRFLNLKSLSGELKRTEIRKGIGYKLTTKEFILQREDQTYHILFEDILGLIQRESMDGRPDEKGTHKIITNRIRVYNRSGVFEKGAATLYASLSDNFCKLFLDYLERSHRSAPGT
ncbi:hypothetical protein [Effusibacillus lacus]|uniref:Uncharacterized protein n=1 Tax=Effusibacillus lacus TaxID=1348429 RepID=A0A292YKU0_9BACL|nr:hypothetical protein [Effusibacillus lacus]TCS70830.1 hypothetical protein EDD64_13062 [Effusibacillus lacus]GAX89373.1 hypothetical protein EFBL_0991 [Effusibacillus lacus]